MSAAKHTPGPWLAEANKKSAAVHILGRRGDGNIRSSDGLGHLVSVDCAAEPDAVMFSPMLPEQVANARLIAAAPDMLEALKGIEHFADAVAYRADPLSTALRGWIQAGVQAIAKAEGRTDA